jgi:hypothetical protein
MPASGVGTRSQDGGGSSSPTQTGAAIIYKDEINSQVNVEGG